MISAFEEAEAAIAPVYDIGQIFEDEQYVARPSFVTTEDPDLGPLKMQNVFPFMSRTPGRIRRNGGRLGQHNEEIWCGEFGLSKADIERLKGEGVM